MFLKKENSLVQSKPPSSIAKIANHVEDQHNKETQDIKQPGVMSPNINFEINLDASDNDSDDVDISHESSKPVNIPNSKHMLSLKRPVSSPTFSRSKRNSSDSKELNNSPESKQTAFLGRVVSAPPTVSSSSSSSTSNKTNNATNGLNSRPVLTVKEKEAEDTNSRSNYGFVPIQQAPSAPIDFLCGPNPTFETLHVQVMCSLKDLLPQEERASFFAQHYQLPLRLYYKLVDSNPQKKIVQGGLPQVPIPKHAKVIPNPVKSQRARIMSPIFQVTVESDVYVNMLRNLKAMSEKVDGCSDFTRVLVWTHLFSLVGCTLSNSKRFGTIIQTWMIEDSINLLAVELLYVAFMLVQILHPSVLSLEKDVSGETKDGIWKNAQVNRKQYPDGAKSKEIIKGEKEYLSEMQARIEHTARMHHPNRHYDTKQNIKQPTVEPKPKNEVRSEIKVETKSEVKLESKSSDNPDYLTLHSRYMLLQNWATTLDHVIEPNLKQQLWTRLSSLIGNGVAFSTSTTFKQAMGGWNRDLNSFAAHVTTMFQVVHDEALRNKRIRELLCFPHTHIPVFSGSDAPEKVTIPLRDLDEREKENDNEKESPRQDTTPSSSSGVMNIKYILS